MLWPWPNVRLCLGNKLVEINLLQLDQGWKKTKLLDNLSLSSFMNFVIEFGYMTRQGEYVSNPVYIVRGSSCSLLKGSEGGWGVRRALSNF